MEDRAECVVLASPAGVAIGEGRGFTGIDGHRHRLG